MILFHANLSLFSGGFVGVDIFFVISGYLITTILIEDIEKNQFSLLQFYERRARRILPALFFVMIACIPFAWMWMLPNQMKEFSHSLIAVSFFASNILFWRESGYFEATAEEKPLLHTWSLAVEEQYYVLFPLFLLLTWRFGKNKVFWMIVITTAISLALSEWGSKNSPTANFYLAPSRAWELLAGSISAFIIQKQGVQKNNILSFIGLGAILYAIFTFDKNTPFPSLYTLIPVIGTVLLILYANAQTIVAKILSVKICVGIGLISYSAYLWHQPLFAFAKIKLFEAPSSSLFILLTILSLILAYGSWRFIEQPFRNKNRIPLKKLITSILLLYLTVITFGVAGHYSDGYKNYLLSDTQKSFLATAKASPKRDACHTGGNDYLTYEESCVYFEGKTQIAVLGDSHGVELSYALAEDLKDRAISVKHLSFSGCPPSYRKSFDGFKDCHDWTNQNIDQLVQDPQIDYVVLSYRIAGYLYGRHEGHYPKLIDEKNKELREEIWHELIQIIETLQAANKKVIYVIQWPELPKVIDFLTHKNVERPTGATREWWNKRMEFVYNNLNKLPKQTIIIDPTPLFCDETTCFAGSKETAYYFDDDHLSVEGASIISQGVLNQTKWK